MEHNYRPSINIIRDSDVELNYLVTSNATRVFDQLMRGWGSGRKSFNIIGAYGTGKSSFLWAFERSIKGTSNFFPVHSSSIKESTDLEFIQIVGDYKSISQVIGERLGISFELEIRPSDVIDEIQTYYEALKEEGKGLILIIDEFGKFLEYASKHDPDQELYFLQLLAEFFNDPEVDGFFITTLHQNFNAYGTNLTLSQRKEWDKIKGRFQELTFNEPVEQLLLLAAQRLTSPAESIQSPKDFNQVFDAIADAKVFPLRDYFNKETAENLLPLDILSAAVLTLALQKFGQNQRSLFSFLESGDHLGLQGFTPDKEDPFYHLALVFDYLQYNYNALLNGKDNPEKTKWAPIRSAIERAEGILEGKVEEAIKIIKAVGLLNIFAHGGALIDEKFLKLYAKKAMGIARPGPILDSLLRLKILRYVRHARRYVPFEGTDVDIELAIDEAGNIVERISDVVPHLMEHFDFPFVLAKKAYYKYGTPRIFGYILSHEPQIKPVQDQIDGYVNLIFSDTLTGEDVRAFSENRNAPVLFGFYTNTSKIGNHILEIEKIRKVISDHPEDRVATRELKSILESQKRLLNHYVIGNQFGETGVVEWFYKGEKIPIGDARDFNKQLSQIVDDQFPDTPHFHNEMVNKTKISGAINTARKKLIHHILSYGDQENIGFLEDKFPPEKTIYLTLLKKTGIHHFDGEGFTLDKPNDSSFLPLWEACDKFLDDAKKSHKNLRELVEKLKAPPLKLKQGFVEFWLPLFLIIKRDNFMLFKDKKYIPELSEENLQLIQKNAGKYEIKAFETDGVHWTLFNRYRNMLQLSGDQQTPSNRGLIEIIKPFLVFYRQLPAYTKNTKVRLKPQTVAVRDTIAKAKDPEALFFEEFPRIFGIELDQLSGDDVAISTYIRNLKDSMTDMRTAYPKLLDRFEDFIRFDLLGDAGEFPAYKEELKSRFEGLKKHLLNQKQKVLIQRIHSPLDDRDSWLVSIAQALIGKSLDQISDAEENILKEQFREARMGLDNLLQIGNAEEDNDEEAIMRLEITAPQKEIQHQVIRIHKNKLKMADRLKSGLEEFINENTEDPEVILAALARLLEDKMKK